MTGKSASKFLVLAGLSAFLSTFTAFFGALPMLVVRRSFGRWLHWFGFGAIGVGFVAFGMAPYGALIIALTILIGTYSEVEKQGSGIFTSGAIAVLASVGSLALMVGAWLHSTNTSLLVELRKQLEPIVENMATVNPQVVVSVDSLVQHFPSAILISLMCALWIALIWEKSLIGLFNLLQPSEQFGEKLSAFRVPDALIWISMLAILGALLQHGVEWLQIASWNLVYVLAVLYFFQGLAVVACALKSFGIGPFWRGMWYVLLVVQLFLMVSFIGFADFWLDFRQRLARKPAESKNERI